MLIVDDEEGFVASLAEASARKPESYDLLTAGDGQRAIEILQQSHVDLVVTDLRMPVLDGFGLLSWMIRHRPLMPVLVMTAFGTPELEKRALGAGALGILEKPLSREALRTAILAKLQQPVEARMSGIGLESVLQLLALEGKSCVLNTPAGQLCLLDGKIVAATAGELKGEKAAVALVSAGGDSFTLGNLPRQLEQHMLLPVDHLLIEVARLVDEGLGIDHVELVLDDDNFLGEATLTSPNKADPEGNTGADPLTAPKAATPEGKKGSIDMSNVKDSLEKAAKIDGAIAVALVDYKSGMTLGVLGGGPQFNIEVAASANTEVVRSKMKAMAGLGLKDKIEDILITLSSQYHLIRMLDKQPGLFLYLALSRDSANLGLARMKLAEVEKNLEI